MIAVALSFGRCSPGDIGPDIAIDVATGIAGHYVRACAALWRALGADRSRLVRRNRARIGHVSMGAYSVVLGRACPPAPDCIDDGGRRDLVAGGARVLEQLAEDALSLGARTARRAA